MYVYVSFLDLCKSTAECTVTGIDRSKDTHTYVIQCTSISYKKNKNRNEIKNQILLSVLLRYTQNYTTSQSNLTSM